MLRSAMAKTAMLLTLISMYLLTGCGVQNFDSSKQMPGHLAFAPMAAQTYGAKPILIEASSASPEPITYSIASGPGSIVGNKLTINGAGTITLRATQPENYTYAAQEATISFAVLPATPMLALAAVPPQTYGTSPLTLAATSSSPEAITFSVISGPGTVTGNLLSITGAGSITVAASQSSDANFTAQSVTEVVSVAPATPTFHVNQIPAQIFGASPIVLSATSSSSAPISYAVTSGKATISGSTLSLTGAGSVTVTATQAANSNYTTQTASTTFSVLPGTPSLSIEPIPNQAFGNKPVTLRTVSSSRAPVSYSITSGPASVSGNILTVLGTGAVTVTAAQPADDDYVGQSATLTFSVAPGSPNLSIGTVSRQTYGVSPLQLTSSSLSPAPIFYQVLSGPATCSGNVLSLTGIGTVTVTAAQEATQNYTAQTVTSSFEVLPASPSLTFAVLSNHFTGDSPFTISATSLSQGAISYSIASGPATISGNLVTVTSSGLVVVTALQAANGNYANQSISTQFTVLNRMVTVTPSSATLTVGTSLQFGATRNGVSTTDGTWVVFGGTSNGSIDQSGLYTAPATLPDPANVSIGYVLNNATTLAQVQIVTPVPSLSSINPASLVQTSTQVQVTGTGFLPGATVLVNGTAVATMFIDSSHLSFTAVLTSTVSTVLTIQTANPDLNSSISNMLQLPATFPALVVTPAVLPLGNFSLSIAGPQFDPSTLVAINGRPARVVLNTNGTLTVSGYLPPWTVGSATISVSSSSSGGSLAEASVPVMLTPVSYDTAARFTTQAAFGPNPTLVEHIQSTGLGAYLDEQMTAPANVYSNFRGTYMRSALYGTSLLRQRVGLALQSFIVSKAWDGDKDEVSFVQMMERDAFGNFRDLMTDVSSDPSLGLFLTLGGNAVSSDPDVHPNQNFARELLQLFTMGPVLLNDDGTTQMDANGTALAAYDQNTILDLSRVLTGWVYPAPLNPDFSDAGIDFSLPLVTSEGLHDTGAKVLFGTAQIPAGLTTVDDRTAALDAIFAHPNVPPYISKLLIQRLVKSAPSPEYVRRVVAVFKDNGSGVRGDLSAVVRAILLDPEARAGDTTQSQTDGFIQEPLLFQLFAMNALQTSVSDDQIVYVSGGLGEDFWHSATVFGFYDPKYNIPGTAINSPEFMLLNNQSIIQRSTTLWGIVNGGVGGLLPNDSGWLYTTFPTVSQFVDALNHLLYHGQMPTQTQTFITQYCSQLPQADQQQVLHQAAFLALNNDSYMVSQ